MIFTPISQIRQLAGLRDSPAGVYEVETLTNATGSVALAGTAVVLTPLSVVASGKLTSFLLPVLGSVSHLPTGVVESSIQDTASGRVIFKGDCYGLLDASATAVITGDPLTVTVNGTFREAVAGDRIFAYSKATGVAGTVCRMMFVGNSGGGAVLSQTGTFADTGLNSTAVVTAQNVSTRTIAIAGLIVGQPVVVSPPASVNVTVGGVRVNPAGTLSIDFVNPSAVDRGIPVGTYYYAVLK